jgi:Domain of Unknown Function (DUF1080)
MEKEMLMFHFPGTTRARLFLRQAVCRVTLRPAVLRQIAMLGMLLSVSALSLLAQDPVQPFLGRWDLTLTNQSGTLPSWIDVSKDQGQVKVLFVGITDHATPLKQADVKAGKLVFVSPKGESGFPADTTYTVERKGARLIGTVANSEQKWSLTGQKAPALPAHTVTEWGKPVKLFNGKDFTGWRFKDPDQASSWQVIDGTLVHNGHGTEIIGIPKFMNFKLHLEFNCGPESNSGVYLRGRYEVQIETDSVAEPPSHHTGGVYGYLNPIPEQPRVSDKWQRYDITFVGRYVTVVQSGVTVIDNKEIPGITGGALDSNEGLPGPIYLQGSEKGRVAFRNIVVTPAKD